MPFDLIVRARRFWCLSNVFLLSAARFVSGAIRELSVGLTNFARFSLSSLLFSSLLFVDW